MSSFVNQKQGIVSILVSDSERIKPEPSLRRTLSADMSSQKWISNIKKVASSDDISVSVIDGSEYNEETKNHKAQNDVWSSIISQTKEVDSANSNLPYIHPLVKRSKSSLSDKSLEICTEGLGSETGSDGFSSYPVSEDEDGDVDEINKEKNQAFEQEDQWRPVKYNYKKSLQRSFPPLLPSLSYPDGGSLRMQPHRDNGRLVLEAMAVPSQNSFCAQRQDGRLVLTLVNPPYIEGKVVSQENEFEKTFTSPENKKDNEEEKETKETKEPKRDSITMKRAPPKISNGKLNAYRLAAMMNSKSIVLAHRNRSSPITHSLPPRPKVAELKSAYTSQPTAVSAPVTATAASSLNAYECYWKSKATSKAAISTNPLAQQPQSFKNSSRKLIVCKNRTPNEQQQLVFSNVRCIATT